MDGNGWVPATAGNLSVRLANGRIAITCSGTHKGFLDAGGIMMVDPGGAALTQGAKSSAETGLHCQLYRLFPDTGAVLHGHSVAATVLSRLVQEPVLCLSGYELLKVFEGQGTHDAALDLPMFDNDQDIVRLAAIAEPLLPRCRLGYLIRGHGVYVWGPSMATALHRLEALEFLLRCELEQRRHS